MVFIAFPVLFVILGLNIISPVIKGSETQCYLKISNFTNELEIIERNCTFRYDINGCADQRKVVLAFSDENRVRVTKGVGQHYVNVSLSMNPPKRNNVIITISGITAVSREKRCVHMYFGLSAWTTENVTLHADFLKLPKGNYNLTGMQPDPKEKHLIAHTSFELTHDFEKRDITPEVCNCPGVDCITISHEYISPELRFLLTTPKDFCSKFSVQLLQSNDNSVSNETSCAALNKNKTEALNHVNHVHDPKSFNSDDSGKIPVSFTITKSGCYNIRTIPAKHYKFVWVDVDLPKVDTWNTTIFIQGRNQDHSVDVAWEIPAYPNNFTLWDLTLWYNDTFRIECHGEKSEKYRVKTSKPSTSPFNGSSYTFTNLSNGFYCVRVSPYHCDDCTLRSSTTVQLNDTLPEVKIDEGTSSWIVYASVSIGMAIVMSLIIIGFIFSRSSPRLPPVYTSVLQEQCQLDPVSVLFIWTKHEWRGIKDYENVINAFKSLLKTYSKCKIYDYLDFNSLDTREKQLFLSSPTEWLEKHLREPQEKIIFIGSQREDNHVANGNNQIGGLADQDKKNSMDTLLFRQARRYLSDSLELSTDYSRIFYVRFPGLYKCDVDFESIVTWTRFNIPNHLRRLTMSLRGLTEETIQWFPEPPEKEIKNLQNLINNCKNQ